MNTADLLIATLRRQGVDWIATLCGHGLDPLFEAARAGSLVAEGWIESGSAVVAMAESDANSATVEVADFGIAGSGIAGLVGCAGCDRSGHSRNPNMRAAAETSTGLRSAS